MGEVVLFPKAKPQHFSQGCSRIIAVPRMGTFHYVLCLDDQSIESGEEYERLDTARHLAAFWSPTVVEEGPPEAFGRAPG